MARLGAQLELYDTDTDSASGSDPYASDSGDSYTPATANVLQCNVQWLYSTAQKRPFTSKPHSERQQLSKLLPDPSSIFCSMHVMWHMNAPGMLP